MSTVCCPRGALPPLSHSGYQDKGEEIVLDTGFKAYVTGSSTAKKAIVVFYDVFGFNGGRTRELCDIYASQGNFLVVLPDFYRGKDCVSAGAPVGSPEFVTWAKQWTANFVHNVISEGVVPFLASKGIPKAIRIIQACSSYLEKTGGVGFCWGVWALFVSSCHLAAGVGCHPSLQISNLFGGSVESVAIDCMAAQPYSTPSSCLLLPSNDEDETVRNGGIVEKVLTEKGLDCDIVDFPDMPHGWVSRGDLLDPSCARDVPKAIELTINFLAKHIKS